MEQYYCLFSVLSVYNNLLPVPVLNGLLSFLERLVCIYVFSVPVMLFRLSSIVCTLIL